MNSVLLVVLAFCCVAGLCWGVATLHEASMRESPRLPLRFDHRDHAETNCAVCHHDYLQASLATMPQASPFCVACHRSMPSQSDHVAVTFHQFCETCHIQKAKEGKPTGPVRLCAACHDTTRPKRVRPDMAAP